MVRIGLRVGQRYVLESEAGAGGMGVVFRATDVIWKTPVAVKLLRSADNLALSRFRREAEVLAQLQHPRVVRYYAHGETDAKEAFLAMEWLEGESLKSRLERGPLPLADLLRVGAAVADALAAAHALNVVHRDVKPANIFLVGGSTEDVKLLDLGVARLRVEGQTLTETGAMIGTPSYMSPEQARGSKDVDHRSDLFALGSVLFCCASQRPPFVEADSLETLFKLTTESAPPLDRFAPTMPPQLVRLVRSLLSLEPQDRPADARVVRDELAAMLTALAPSAALQDEPTMVDPPRLPAVSPTVVQQDLTVPAATVRLPSESSDGRHDGPRTSPADTTVRAERVSLRRPLPETTLDERRSARKVPLWLLLIVIPLVLAAVVVGLKLTLKR